MSQSIPPSAPAKMTRLPEEVAQAMKQASLTSWIAPTDDSRVIFQERTTPKGKKYRVGHEIPDDVVKDEWIAAHSHLFDGSVGDNIRIQETGGSDGYYYANANVDWPFVKYGDMKRPLQMVVDDLHITEYNLNWNSGGWRDYVLWIRSDKEAHYTFYDEEGDHYDLRVAVTAYKHYVTYDSHEPNIVRIHGYSVTPF